MCDAELPEIISAMEVNHTRIQGTTNCEALQKPVAEENIPELFNAFSPGFIHAATQKPTYPVIESYLDNSANQIPQAVTKESPVEVKVVPLPPGALLRDKSLDKSSSVIINNPVDLEMVL